MNEILMSLIVDLLHYFDTCPDEEVDPDSAVKWMENISFALQQLQPDELKTFLDYVQKLSDTADRKEAKDYWRSLPRNMGLVEDES